MKVLRSAVFIALLSLEVATVISEENIYYRPNNQETYQANKKVSTRFGRRSGGGRGLISGGHGKFDINLGGGGGLKGKGHGKFGIGLGVSGGLGSGEHSGINMYLKVDGGIDKKGLAGIGGGGELESGGYSGINMHLKGGGGIEKQRPTGIGGGGGLGNGVFSGINMYLKGGVDGGIGKKGFFGFRRGGELGSRSYSGINMYNMKKGEGIGSGIYLESGGKPGSKRLVASASSSANGSSGYGMGFSVVRNNPVAEKKKLSLYNILATFLL